MPCRTLASPSFNIPFINSFFSPLRLWVEADTEDEGRRVLPNVAARRVVVVQVRNPHRVSRLHFSADDRGLSRPRPSHQEHLFACDERRAISGEMKKEVFMNVRKGRRNQSAARRIPKENLCGSIFASLRDAALTLEEVDHVVHDVCKRAQR